MYSLGVVSSLFAINRFNRARLLARERDRTRERELAQAGEIEKAYQELKSTQAQLIEQEKKEALYKEQLKIQQVRNKIASELHDDIGSTLSSIHLFSEVAKKKIKQDSLDALPMLEKIESSSQEMMQSMNEIVWAIHSKNDDTILFSIKYTDLQTKFCRQETLSSVSNIQHVFIPCQWIWSSEEIFTSYARRRLITLPNILTPLL